MSFILEVLRTTKSAALRSGGGRERLRRSYRPSHVRMLFIGESPPASGRFFYQADSGLYRAIRRTFMLAFPAIRKEDFLLTFRDLSCYLIDLCGEPVDDLDRKERKELCESGEGKLSRAIGELQPEIVVTLVLSIAPNVRRAIIAAGWNGEHVALPYPGQWKRNRVGFDKGLRPLLLRELSVKRPAKKKR